MSYFKIVHGSITDFITEINEVPSHYRGFTWEYYDPYDKTWRQFFRSYAEAEKDIRARGYISSADILAPK